MLIPAGQTERNGAGLLPSPLMMEPFGRRDSAFFLVRAVGCGRIRLKRHANREGGGSHERDHLDGADADARQRIQDPANHQRREHAKVGLYVEMNDQRPRCNVSFGNGVRSDTR